MFNLCIVTNEQRKFSVCFLWSCAMGPNFSPIWLDSMKGYITDDDDIVLLGCGSEVGKVLLLWSGRLKAEVFNVSHNWTSEWRSLRVHTTWQHNCSSQCILTILMYLCLLKIRTFVRSIFHIITFGLTWDNSLLLYCWISIPDTEM